MLCSDFETWNTAHLLARMAGEGYGALAPLPSTPTSLRNSTSGSNGPLGDATRSVTTLNDVGGDGGGGGAREPAVWLVLRKQLLQWLLAVSARCGDARASCEYFAGLAELMAALEEEREKADREWIEKSGRIREASLLGRGAVFATRLYSYLDWMYHDVYR